MFFCESCRVKNKWPESFSRSYGPCECCEKTTTVYDVPSRYLPVPPRPARLRVNLGGGEDQELKITIPSRLASKHPRKVIQAHNFLLALVEELNKE